MQHLTLDHVPRPLEFLILRTQQPQHMGRTADGSKRVAQLVCKHGEEFVLAAIGFQQQLLAALAFGDVHGYSREMSRASRRITTQASLVGDPQQPAVGRDDAKFGIV